MRGSIGVLNLNRANDLKVNDFCAITEDYFSLIVFKSKEDCFSQLRKDSQIDCVVVIIESFEEGITDISLIRDKYQHKNIVVLAEDITMEQLSFLINKIKVTGVVSLKNDDDESILSVMSKAIIKASQ